MNDLKFAFRQLLKNPGFTAVAVLAFALGLSASTASAHPGVGIVRDSRGNVFFTDLAQVWGLVPDGTRSVAVSNVHTHELCLDARDNLFGEHLWYDGTTRKWGHYVWRRSPDGRVEQVIPPSHGFLANYSFVRDATGAMYWADRETTGGPAIRKRSPDGRVTTLLQSKSLHDIGFMTCSPNGTVYLIDRSDLICASADGQLRVLAGRLSGDRFKFRQRHKVQGLSADDAGNVWVAVSERRVVKKVSKDGAVTVVAQLPTPFRPNGVLATPDGHLWILEDSLPNRARVRHIAPDGSERVY
ncbi:MAG: hypothetical protein L0Z50_24405 [Verrucomicrobiales bacterium]|nr:hypothetical protein [Verrucomicrobiales bacterium]